MPISASHRMPLNYYVIYACDGAAVIIMTSFES